MDSVLRAIRNYTKDCFSRYYYKYSLLSDNRFQCPGYSNAVLLCLPGGADYAVIPVASRLWVNSKR